MKTVYWGINKISHECVPYQWFSHMILESDLEFQLITVQENFQFHYFFYNLYKKLSYNNEVILHAHHTKVCLLFILAKKIFFINAGKKWLLFKS